MNMMNVDAAMNVNEVSEVSPDEKKKRKSKKLSPEEKERRKEARKQERERLKALEKARKERMKVFIESEDEIKKRHAACKYNANAFVYNPVIVVRKKTDETVSATHKTCAVQRTTAQTAAVIDTAAATQSQSAA